ALSNYDIADHDKYEFSYYTDLEDARDAINPITNPSAFTATGTHTIYVRLDYDWNEIGLTKEEDCFDIISFEVIVSSAPELPDDPIELEVDRKSTRLNSSHVSISYAVFCLKKKTI